MKAKQAAAVYMALNGKQLTDTSKVSIVSTIKRYEIVAEDHDLTPSQKSKHLVYAYVGDALEYFTLFWKLSMPYKEEKHKTQPAYSSPAIQETINAEMVLIDIDLFMRSKYRSDPEAALAVLIEHKNSNVSACARNTDRHCIYVDT